MESSTSSLHRTTFPCIINMHSTPHNKTLLNWAPPQTLKKQPQNMRKSSMNMIKCGKNTSVKVGTLSKEFEEIEKHEEECREMGNCREVVELMECLENEAIMGDDVGRHPFDYNRRALIFDKSSKVFQAHKELAHSEQVRGSG